MERNITKPVKKLLLKIHGVWLTDTSLELIQNLERSRIHNSTSCVRCCSRGKGKDTRFYYNDGWVGFCLNKCFEDYQTLKDYNLDSDEDE